MGSGTTGVVAKILKRNFIGIEKSQEYANLAKKRIGEIN
jgi:site-specific DNA-methyltransferase (adenine-specific)